MPNKKILGEELARQLIQLEKLEYRIARRRAITLAGLTFISFLAVLTLIVSIFFTWTLERDDMSPIFISNSSTALWVKRCYKWSPIHGGWYLVKASRSPTEYGSASKFSCGDQARNMSDNPFTKLHDLL